MKQTRLIQSTMPFKVRTSCGHIVIRRMREETAGVPYTDATVLDAPNGAPCSECEAAAARERRKCGGYDGDVYAWK